MSSDRSSGRSLDRASTNTGPTGAGGNCGSEDTGKVNVSGILRVVAESEVHLFV